MVQNLRTLYQDSKELLNIVGLHTTQQVNIIIGQLQQPSSKATIRLQRLARRFIETRETSFGQRSILKPDIIAYKIAGLEPESPLPRGTWRPDGIVYLANLATTLLSLLNNDRSDNDIVSLLMLLRQKFPVAFASGLNPSSSYGVSLETSFVKESLEIALELETQLTISMLLNKRAEGTDAVELIRRIWNKGSDDFHLLNRPSLHTGQNFRQMIEDRIQRFETPDVEDLQHAFPWEEFLPQMVFWIQARASEIEEQLKAQGGVDEILKLVGQTSAEIVGQSNQSTEPHDQMRSPLREMTLSEAKSRSAVVPIDPKLQPAFEGHRSAGDWLREKRAKIANRQSTTGSSTLLNPYDSTPTSAQLPLSGPNDSDASVAADTQVLSSAQAVPQVSQEVIHVLEASDRHNAERNKENARAAPFNMRQADAHKVTWDNTQAEELTVPGPKRSQVDLEDDGEGTFEVDRRERPKKSRRAGDHAPAPHRRPDHHARRDARPSLPQRATVDHVQSRNLLAHRPSNRPPLSSTSASNDGDHGPDQEPQIDPDKVMEVNAIHSSQSYATANAQAKANAQAARAHQASFQQRQPQRRKPWSAEETDRLIELIEEHGVGWAHIMRADAIHRDGPLLQERGQVGLKDKARNMKMDYYK